MKISINLKFFKNSYGGGNQFRKSLQNFLIKKEHKVVNNLNDNDIDIILLISPFKWQSSSSYSYIDAKIYKLKHPNTIIIHRVNECDERKKTNYMNKNLIKANRVADYTVYISEWLKSLFEKEKPDKNNSSEIIRNGADTTIFNPRGKAKWKPGMKMKIVTHHWSDNYMKGHDIYQRLDKLLEKKKYKDRFEFSFIGRVPKYLNYKNTRIIPARSGQKLAKELKKNHLYLTASRFEPAGMHHIEAGCCGLPILFINSGALPEYCSDYGVMFEKDNFEEKLMEIYNNYDKYLKKLGDYKYTAERTCGEYLNLFEKLYSQKKEMKIKRREPPFLKVRAFLLKLKEIYEFLLIKFYFVKNKLIK